MGQRKKCETLTRFEPMTSHIPVGSSNYLAKETLFDALLRYMQYRFFSGIACENMYTCKRWKTTWIQDKDTKMSDNSQQRTPQQHQETCQPIHLPSDASNQISVTMHKEVLMTRKPLEEMASLSCFVLLALMILDIAAI